MPRCSVHVSSPPVPDDSELSTYLLDRIRRGYEADPFYRQSSTLQTGASSDSRFTKDNTGLWMYLGKRVCVPRGGTLKHSVLFELHDSPTGGHASIKRTIARVYAKFYFPDVVPFGTKYVEECTVRNRAKALRQLLAPSDPLLVPPYP